jgi:hypothetical protein
MSSFIDIWHDIQGILTGSDWLTLGAIVIIATSLAFMTEGFSMLITSTFVALVAFGVVMIARSIFIAGGKTDAAGLIQDDWHAFMDWQVHLLLAYAIIFALLIALAGSIRRMAAR